MSTPPPGPYQPPQPPYGEQPSQGQPQMPPPPPAYPQGGQQWGYGSTGVPQGPGGESPKNFFAALFDWRFHTLITPKIVSWVYLATMILSGLYWLFLVFAGFASEPVIGVLALIVGPIVLVISLAFFRMTLEFYFAVVRMSDDIHRSNQRVGS
ncbi:DUF4282 domain-containing protein [Georgenia sp. H159]|uniref:DUF4282 domain-containing protein n=1 Tax=Georgenia sp. H159 TaxID=3076115 RepID=UPI002D770007|nr:DUF4282 domain-containing protein [Georgenia sp. H159]